MRTIMLSQEKPLFLTQTDWPNLAQSVKEKLVIYMQCCTPPRELEVVRLVVSLRLINYERTKTEVHHLNSLAAWLSLQCRHIEVTASWQPRHKLYID